MKAIGPVPITGKHESAEGETLPFKVNRNSPHQQALAKKVGWAHLERLEKIDAQEPDQQRSPFPKGGVEVKPR